MKSQNQTISNNVDWAKILTRQITPQILPIVTSPKYYFFKTLGAGFKNQLYVPRGRKHEFYFSGKEWSNFGEAVIKKIEGDKNFIWEHTKSCVASCDVIKSLTMKIREADLTEKKREEFKEFYSEYIRKFDEYIIFMWTPHIIEDYLEKTIREELKKELITIGKIDSFDNFMSIISTKIKLNLAELEEVKLLEIAKKSKERGGQIDDEIDGLIKDHTDKWAWLPFYSLDMSIWKNNYFTERVRKFEDPIGELLKRKENTSKKTENLKRIKGTLKKNQKLLDLIEILQDYLFLRTDRTDTLRIILYNTRPFLEEIARRIRWEYDEVIYLTPDEVLNFLNKGILADRNEIKNRQKHFLILTKGKEEIHIISKEDEIRKIIERELGKERGLGIKEKAVVKGVGVFPGIVRGRVKIIENVTERDKMKEGDVLVTTMTTPEMVEIYSKAKAIVTDEGGITCHAAIVSRELKKPCVIGTGEATSVFMDDMLVEVNSREGIVSTVST